MGKAWMPAEDGDYCGGFVAVEDDGTRIAVYVDDDRGYAYEQLPDDLRLCRSTDVPALDMPDGPGWWAYSDYVGRWVAELTMWDVSDNRVRFCFAVWQIPFDELPAWQFKQRYPGKWYRLTMPWEAA